MVEVSALPVCVLAPLPIRLWVFCVPQRVDRAAPAPFRPGNGTPHRLCRTRNVRPTSAGKTDPTMPGIRKGRLLTGAGLALTLCVGPSPIAAQTSGSGGDASPPDNRAGSDLVATSLPSDQELELDGYLDEKVWSRAEAISDFTQQEPVEGGTPSERTEVRVAFDEDNLYIGAMIFDDPDGILAYQKRRDAGLGTDDRFMWILDTFLDGRTGYFFEINPAGLMGDGLITGAGGHRGINKSWDGIWEARVQWLEDGWSAEIRIPFKTLNFDPEQDTWGINFQRTIRRKNEEILWRGYLRNQGLFRPVHAGRLRGLENPSQGLGLEAVPSVVGSWRNVPENADPNTYPGEVSLDLGYSITPGLRAAVSLNTDFAEVEVDQRRVNLTRFPLRFQEKRDFFLEGSGVFSFSPRSGPSPYFSRRIGLESGEQIPITYGARLGGQAGRYELGFIQVRTGEERVGEEGLLVPVEDFTVARVKRSFLAQSSIGAIYTRRATGASEVGEKLRDRHTAGMDLDFFTSTLFGRYNFQAEAFFVWNSNPDAEVDRSFSDLTARGFRLNFPNDEYRAHLSYREFGHDYSPAVGFVRRNGFRRVEPNIGWRPRPDIDWIRRFEFSAQYRYLADLESGVAEEKQWRLDLFGVDFESGDNLRIQATRQYEFLENPFEISDGVDILPGSYANWEYSIRGRTAGRRRVSGDAGLSTGGFWDGDRTRYELGLTWRPNPGLSLRGEWERNQVELPRGSFQTTLVRLSSGWDMSPWASVTGNVQYDDVSEIVGLFTRLRWILHPGNELYLVYTHNWRNRGPDLLDRDFETLSRGASTKLSYTYRF